MIHSPLRKNGNLDRNAKLYVSNDAVAAAVLTLPTGSWTQAEFSQQDRVTPFEDFGVSDASVYPGGALPVRTGAAAAGDGFVVTKSLRLCFASEVTAKSEREIIGITLRSSTRLEAF
jgi:hypothetical protein